MKKLSIVIFVVLVIIGGYFFIFKKQSITLSENQTQSTNNSDWKTYTNKDLGFEVTYPNTWNVGLEGTDNVTHKLVSVSLIAPNRDNSTSKSPTLQFFIQYNANPNKLSIHDWATDKLNKIKTSTSLVDEVIGEKSAVSLKMPTDIATSNKQFFVTTNDTDILTITYAPDSKSDQIYKNILSNIKFLTK
jgi:hypothetical protein